ncbi:MAG: DUF4981 domain-containing protein [Roseburia sp.]|nr:DUF4981 domain-containing protein [Roseburia sp.]
MKEFDVKKLRDPEFFMENRMAAHSDHVCYRSWEEAADTYGAVRDISAVRDGACGASLAFDPLGKKSSFRLFLDGTWKFHYAKNYEQTIPGFEKDTCDCRNWADIRVPAHIQMEGYDSPQYANTQYPWDGREEIWTEEMPEEFNPVASYVKYFTLPERFAGERVFVSFQGAESGLVVWLNGQYIGYSEDSFTPSDFELTPYLKDGENKLAVQVFKWTIGSWCEDQDFYRFSGLFRSVYLYAVPKTHIWDMKVRPLVEADLEKAQLDLTCQAWGAGSVRLRLLASGRLDDADSRYGEPAGSVVLEKEETLRETLHVAYPIEAPKLWSAEEPYLYELRIEVLDEAGELSEVISQKIGFRRFEMKDGLMCLNGKRIVFKGVNRHEFSSLSGRVVSLDETLLDIVTMKRNNINAIRTSHYPNSVGLYELCDRYGIYMIAENNLESHGTWDAAIFRKSAGPESVVPGDNQKWEARMLDRVNSCYQRDKNHPAILIWSCGNEAYGGSVIYHMSEKFRELDADRLVHYEGVYNDRRYNGSSDMESQMYPSVERILKNLDEQKEKPFICCEYTHAMGNSCGAMHKYTDLTDSEPRYQGGFIWDYIDQSISAKDRYGSRFQAYGGDFMERPTDYNFSGNGICYAKDRAPSPKMQEVKFNYQNISVLFAEDSFTVRNKNLFVNTEIYDGVLMLQKNGICVEKKKLSLAVPPLSEKTFSLRECGFGSELLSYPDNAGGAGAEYALTVSFVLKEDMLWAKAGHEVAFGQKVYPVRKEAASRAAEGAAGWRKPDTLTESAGQCAAGGNAAFRVIHGKCNLGVKGEDFEVLFSYNSCGLVSYRYQGRELIEKIPMPNFWRAPIDNDCGNRMQGRMAQWKIASLYAGMSSTGLFDYQPPVVVERENAVSITYVYCLPTTPQSKCEVTYTVLCDGTVETKLFYDPVKELGDMPEFGMLFKLNADYDRLEWYGLGPQETYADRMRGAKLGIYRNRVADNMAEYLVPQECGNKVGVRYAKVTDERGRGMLFTGDNLSFSALPYTPHELENAMHAYELPQVHYTVVRVALMQMGVGGDDSWGSLVHPEYHIDVTKPLEFTFKFRGI